MPGRADTPSLAEQHEIVRRVGTLFERADAIDREVAAAGRRCERLTQAVLGKAFAYIKKYYYFFYKDSIEKIIDDI